MFKPKKKKYRIINGTKGVISLFLACLLVPFTTLACALLTAARINSAVAIFDEALCNASNSTLGTYDSFLRKRFGLLAMAQNTSGKSSSDGSTYTVEDLINQTFNEFLKENLKTLNNTYTTSTAMAKGVYSLADTDVLLAQVLEYSKYSVPAKLVADGLDLDDLVGYIEKLFESGFAIGDFITSLLGSVDSIISLCDDYQTLKNDVTNETTAKNSYVSKWNAFSSAAAAYKSKYDEMQAKIQTQQSIIDSESANVDSQKSKVTQGQENYNQSTKKINAYSALLQRLEDLQAGKTVSPDDATFLNRLKTQYNYTLSQTVYDAYCADYEAAISELTKLKKNEETNNSTLKRTYNLAKSEYETTNSKISAAEQEIINIKNRYSSELTSLSATADEKKAEYISSITTLQGKLKSTQTSLTKVQSDLISSESAITGTVTQGISSALTLQKTTAESQLTAVNEKIKKCEEEQNSDAVAELNKTKAELEAQLAQLKSSDTSDYANAYSKGLSSALNTIKIGNKDKNINEYDTIWAKLESAKTTTESVAEYKLSLPAGCYVSITQVVTKDEASTMWKDFLTEIFNGTLWGTIEAMKTIMKTLLAFEGAVNSALNALVDTGYFPNGLPSTQNTKSEIITEDQSDSTRWKNLLGSYSSIGDDASGTGDLANVLSSLGGQLDTLSGIDKASEDQEPSETKGFFSTCKSMISGFLDALNVAIDAVKGIFNTSNLYQKMLLSGYFVYMTQNRTTYSKTNLSGNSFNLRGQPTSTAETGILAGAANSFAGFFGDVDGMTTVKQRCFYGAETEYLFGQSMNELQNQQKTFGFIYLIRLVFDLPSLMLSADFLELVTSLAPTIIGSIVILILYIIVEPLLDTLILVNGGQIPLIKTSPFLTSSGFSKLMKCIGTCSNAKLQKSDLKNQLADNVNSMYSKIESSTKVSTKTNDSLSERFNPFYIDYTEQIFLLTMCMPSNRILDTLSDIIQMEASENQQHQPGNVKTFDLTQAYTYVRVKASFTTNEFIKLTDTGMFNSTERVIYRGY